MIKKTKLTLHISKGEGKAPQHIQLWNSDHLPEIFFGGTAEIQDVGGKKDMKIITTSVEVNGSTYQNPSEPYVAFINRFPNDEQKKTKAKPYTGNIAKVVIRAQGADKKAAKDLGVLLFVNDGTVLAGYWNDKGLDYDEKFRIDSKKAGTVHLTADVVGGMKEDLLAQLLTTKPKEKAKK